MRVSALELFPVPWLVESEAVDAYWFTNEQLSNSDFHEVSFSSPLSTTTIEGEGEEQTESQQFRLSLFASSSWMGLLRVGVHIFTSKLAPPRLEVHLLGLCRAKRRRIDPATLEGGVLPFWAREDLLLSEVAETYLVSVRNIKIGRQGRRAVWIESPTKGHKIPYQNVAVWSDDTNEPSDDIKDIEPLVVYNFTHASPGWCTFSLVYF